MADENDKDRIPGTTPPGGAGGRAAPPSETAVSPRGVDGPAEEGPRDHAGGQDAIDRAAEGETQEAGPGVHDPDGAAFPSPAGGAVLTPSDDEVGDPATEHPDEGTGAGDELRGGAGGPLPPGTGRPLPDPDADPDDEDGRARVTPEEAAFGRDAAGLAARRDPAEPDADPAEGRSADLIPGDGPTAREAEPAGGAEAGSTVQAMRALGVEAGRNGWVLWVLGIAAIVAGAIALAMPLVASFTAVTVVAAMLLASGAIGLVTSFRYRDGGAIAAGFALSALAVLTGGLMLLAPLAGITALSIIIVAYFLASGVARAWLGIRHSDIRGRGWLIASGVLSVVLALVLWVGFPGSALWLPGVLLAIDLIVYGALMISLAVFGKPKLDADRMA